MVQRKVRISTPASMEIVLMSQAALTIFLDVDLLAAAGVAVAFAAAFFAFGI